jgi:hypothetical protein
MFGLIAGGLLFGTAGDIGGLTPPWEIFDFLTKAI